MEKILYMPQETDRRKVRSNALVLWVMLEVLLFGVAAIVILFPHQNLSDVWKLATTHQPETYNELYFENPAKLPGYAPTGSKQTLTFRIVNHMHATEHYHLQSTVAVNGQSTVHDSYIVLADAQSTVQSVSFIIPKPNQSAVINIQLVGSNQHLLFRSSS